MVDPKRCRSCIYSGASYGGVCDYLSVTGRSRIAQETPEDAGRPCRFYHKGRYAPEKKRPNAAAPTFRFSQVRLMVLYREGLNDQQIAREIGCTDTSVRKFRIRNNLPNNFREAKKDRKEAAKTCPTT